MRQSFLIVLLSMGMLTSYAQESKKVVVPASVISTFAKAYPNVKDVEWEAEGQNFEADFELSKKEWSVLYDAKGNLLQTEEEISAKQLPKAALEYISSNINKAKVEEAARITDANGVVTYEAEVNELDIIFDSNGQYLRTELSQKD